MYSVHLDPFFARLVRHDGHVDDGLDVWLRGFRDTAHESERGRSRGIGRDEEIEAGSAQLWKHDMCHGCDARLGEYADTMKFLPCPCVPEGDAAVGAPRGGEHAMPICNAIHTG